MKDWILIEITLLRCGSRFSQALCMCIVIPGEVLPTSTSSPMGVRKKDSPLSISVEFDGTR
jgi:hypothetical protein